MRTIIIFTNQMPSLCHEPPRQLFEAHVRGSAGLRPGVERPSCNPTVVAGDGVLCDLTRTLSAEQPTFAA